MSTWKTTKSFRRGRRSRRASAGVLSVMFPFGVGRPLQRPVHQGPAPPGHLLRAGPHPGPRRRAAVHRPDPGRVLSSTSSSTTSSRPRPSTRPPPARPAATGRSRGLPEIRPRARSSGASSSSPSAVLLILANFEIIIYDTLFDFWPVAVIVIGLKLVADVRGQVQERQVTEVHHGQYRKRATRSSGASSSSSSAAIFLLEQFDIDVWDAGLALLARHPDRLGRQQALARAQGAERALRDARPGQDP
ncbi:MAG: hypothetical protein M0C28_02850 [Candidatus Moduliflexus flocculans]|nr:hypothetical protein [Candidatus Moduliflexus flocculans]